MQPSMLGDTDDLQCRRPAQGSKRTPVLMTSTWLAWPAATPCYLHMHTRKRGWSASACCRVAGCWKRWRACHTSATSACCTCMRRWAGGARAPTCARSSALRGPLASTPIRTWSRGPCTAGSSCYRCCAVRAVGYPGILITYACGCTAWWDWQLGMTCATCACSAALLRSGMRCTICR
jgi:hypothetical protein